MNESICPDCRHGEHFVNGCIGHDGDCLCKGKGARPGEPYEQVDHPDHYGGADDVYEAIKVIDAWGIGFALGNAVKYISRAGRKPGVDALTDLRKAAFYLQHEITRLERVKP